MIRISLDFSPTHGGGVFKRNPHYSLGFTIVELLIVIVIIAILATLVIIGYRGLQQRANNVQTVLALEDTVKAIQSYAQYNQKYPEDNTNPGVLAMTCIGDDYEDNKCMDVSSGSPGACNGTVSMVEASWFSNELKTLLNKSPMPSKQKISCNGRDIVGAVYAANFGSPGTSVILYFLAGDVSCSAPAGLMATKTYSTSSASMCVINLPTL